MKGLYILHHGKLTAVGGRFLYARHLENVVFDLGGVAVTTLTRGVPQPTGVAG